MLARVLKASDWDGFPARREEATRRGRLRGIGLACYLESSGVAPSRLAGALGAQAGFFESAEIRVDPTGGVRALLGTHNHGQGHATTFAQIVADRLGVPLDRIEIVEGDTAVVPFGTGTFGSRSIAVGGSALDRAARKILVKGWRLAAHLLEAAEADIDFHEGAFRVVGTDRQLSFSEIARAAHVAHSYPADFEPGLHETAFYDPTNFAFSNGAHVSELEIDPETAQLQSASLMDYALPRADEMPAFASEVDESQPCTHNPLGAKGCGESGTIGAPAAVVSAGLDALGPLGVRDLDMPLTPFRVWQAVRAARART